MAYRKNKKIQFFYDPENVTYYPVKPTPRKILGKIALTLALSFILASTTLYVYNQYYPTPKEMHLEAQQDQLLYQWEILERESKALNQELLTFWNHDEEIRRILELDSLPLEIRAAGIGGAEYSSLSPDSRIRYEKKIEELYKNINSLKAKLEIQSTSFDTLMSYAIEREKFWSSIPAIQPVENKDLRRLSTVYGMRLHPIYKKYMPHRGFDFMGHIGVPIHATGDGKVRLARATSGGFGLLVEIDHGYGYRTRYAHLSGFKVIEGQEVKRGEIIGYMGNSGRSAGPHLHYEVLKDNVQVNPIGFFERGMSEEAYARLIERVSQPTQPLD